MTDRARFPYNATLLAAAFAIASCAKPAGPAASSNDAHRASAADAAKPIATLQSAEVGQSQPGRLPEHLRTRGLESVPTAPRNTAPALDNALVSLYAELETLDGIRTRPKDGARVRSRERIEFFVTVYQEAFVYLVQVFPDDSAEVLYPAAGDLAWAPGGPYRIPEDPGTIYAFDDKTGTERIYLVTSKKPLRQNDAGLADVLEQIRQGHAVPAAPSSTELGAGQGGTQEPPRQRPSVVPQPAGQGSRLPPEGIVGLATRGMVEVRKDSGQVVDAQSATDGVAIIALTYSHEY